MKNKIFPALSLVIIISLLTSCGVVRVNSDFDRQADFSNYKTFAFHKKGVEKLKLNDLDKKRIVKSLEQQLTAKGLTMSAKNPDLIVNVLTSSKEQVDVDQNPWGWGWGWGPWWGGGFNNTTVRQYTSGTIIVDLVDNKRNILVWQGSGSGLNVSNLDKKADRIPAAIEQIMAKFPPKAKS